MGEKTNRIMENKTDTERQITMAMTRHSEYLAVYGRGTDGGR